MSNNHDSVSGLLNAAGRIPLLTHDEEIMLSRRVQAMQALLADNPSGPYSDDERRIIRTGKRAKERMINANLRLVVSIAKKYIRAARHLELGDLIQEGMFGLIRGVEKFDPERGYRLSTYGYWWIRQSITRGISQSERTIRLPVNAIECLGKLRLWLPLFIAEHGRSPTYDECAAYCGVQPTVMRHYMEHTNGVSSLDGAIRGAEDMCILDTVAADTPDAYEAIELEDGAIRLSAWLSHLNEYQQSVITLRHGLNGLPPMSQSEVSKKLGVSRQAIQQAERASIMRLRVQAASMRQTA